MDPPPITSRPPSGIPRPSRLPLPRPIIRPSVSRENLQQPQNLNTVNPRLRSAPSREQLSPSTSTKHRIPSTPIRSREPAPLPRERDVSTGTTIYTPTQLLSRRTSHDILFRKPSQTFFGENEVGRGLRDREESVKEDAELILEESEEPAVSPRNIRRNPRPSLAERTVETLQNIPSSPAIGRRRDSSFYSSDNPMRPTSSGIHSSRPGSRQYSDGSMRPPSSHSVRSRPASSAGSGPSLMEDFRSTVNTLRPQASFTGLKSMARLGTGKSLKKPFNINSDVPQPPTLSASKLPSPSFSSSIRQQSPSPARSAVPGIKPGSKTLTARPLKPRASVNGLFRKASMQTLNQSINSERVGIAQKKKPAPLSNSSSKSASKAPKVSVTASSSNESEDIPLRKSSMALRDQIAKAKAAKRATAQKAPTSEPPVIATGNFDFGLSEDPFEQHIGQDGGKGLLHKRIVSARADGRLNIAAMGFKHIPEEVMNMYSLEAIGAQDGSWAEAVDLTRLIAADNELELLDHDVFPDIDFQDIADDEVKGNQFGGLEMLDLHGNVLKALPLGLRRLELLTTLNISNNKLSNDCFEVISQLSSLRDLKVGGNNLSGPLNVDISNLKKLEVLDLQRNSLVTLPEGLSELVRLRILNVNENKLTSIPFDALRQVHLTELLASKNKLAGALISTEVDELSYLQVLDISCNSLTTFNNSGSVSFPSLHQLNCSSNRITELPDMSSWLSLLTLTAEDNNLSSIPQGFVNLPKIKSVDFNGNNIKVLDDNIGGMDSLDIFRISGNPLRDKKFASMATDDMKRALKARMTPPEYEIDNELDVDGGFDSSPTTPVTPSRPGSAEWPVSSGNILDRSNTQSHSLNPVAAAQIATSYSIKALELHHNKFKEIPSSIAFFATTLTSLSLSHNELNGDMFMNDHLELPVLKELNLSSNTFNSLQPLIQHLEAPELEKLDISFNRLTSLPVLRQHFPKLVFLFASNNTIRELSPESVKGLKQLDCNSNEINSLNSRIGLLGGPGGLQRLDVSGNRFRVPKYTILEKGTEATLAWLKDRIPTGDVSNPDA